MSGALPPEAAGSSRSTASPVGWIGGENAAPPNSGTESALTVMVTVSVEEAPWKSVTTRENARASSRVSPVGAVKVGCAAAASLSATVRPPVWLQSQVRARPSGSALPLPSRVTSAPWFTVSSSPASAAGAVLGRVTVTT